MGMTIPPSMNNLQIDQTIAIRADDWNKLNTNLNALKDWRNTEKQTALNGHYSVSPSSFFPKNYSGYSIFSNVNTTTVNQNNIIKADYYNELVNKINQMGNTNEINAIANVTLIKADIINSLMNKLSNLNTSITIDVTYTDKVPIVVEGVTVGYNYPTSPFTQTFNFTEPEIYS